MEDVCLCQHITCLRHTLWAWDLLTRFFSEYLSLLVTAKLWHAMWEENLGSETCNVLGARSYSVLTMSSPTGTGFCTCVSKAQVDLYLHLQSRGLMLSSGSLKLQLRLVTVPPRPHWVSSYCNSCSSPAGHKQWGWFSTAYHTSGSLTGSMWQFVNKREQLLISLRYPAAQAAMMINRNLYLLQFYLTHPFSMVVTVCFFCLFSCEVPFFDFRIHHCPVISDFFWEQVILLLFLCHFFVTGQEAPHTLSSYFFLSKVKCNYKEIGGRMEQED